MTSKRCKEILQSLKFMIDDYTDEVEEALDMAIEALKERAKDEGTWRHFEGELECSKCGARFLDEIMDLCGDDVPVYCPSCGNCKLKVDWSGCDDNRTCD